MAASDPNRGVSRRAFLAALGLSGAGALTTAGASGKPGSDAPIKVIQEQGGLGACGPYAVANALVNGDAGGQRAFDQLAGKSSEERTQAFIEQYASKPSETYGKGRGRFVNHAGIATADMPFLVNDFLGQAHLPPVRGDWLDVASGEDPSTHLRRVHGLLKAALSRGFPPLLEIRAFGAESRYSQPEFANLYAHWLTLVGVEPPELPAQSSGFICRFADSFTGRLIPGFAYAERFRPFTATKGFALRATGTKDWHWLSGYPYILLELPDVPLLRQTRAWHERTFVALGYLVHRPTEV